MDCACGQPLHYTDPDIQAMVTALVDELGEYTPVTVPGLGTWLVQRHYVALHGLRAADLPETAIILGFEKVDSHGGHPAG